MALSVGEVEATLRLRDEMSGKLKLAMQQMGGFDQTLRNVSQRVQQAGSAITKSVTLPLAALGVGALKASIDFESSFAGIVKTVDGVVNAQGKLTTFGKTLQREMRAMARDIPTSVNELNRIGEVAGQLGVKSSEIMRFTRTVADLGVATELTTEQAATGLAKFANIIDNELGPQYDRLGATLVDLGNKSAATEQEILDFSQRLAAAGKIAGLTEADIMGFGAALSSVGIEAEAGGTAFSQVFAKITEAVMTGNESLETFAHTAGFTGPEAAAKFAKAFKDDAGSAIISFVEGLGGIIERGEDVYGVLAELELNNERMKRSLLSAASAGDLMRESLKNAAAAFAENSALTVEASRRYGTLESRLFTLWNNVKDLAITLGDALRPAIELAITAVKTMLPLVQGAVEWFSRLPEPVQIVAAMFALLLASVGPLIYLFGSLGLAMAGLGTAASVTVAALKGFEAWLAVARWGAWGDVVSKVGRSYYVLTGGVDAATASVTGFSLAVGRLLTALGLVTTALYVAYKGWQAYNEMSNWSDEEREAAAAAGAFADLGGSIEQAGLAAKAAAPKVKTLAVDVTDLKNALLAVAEAKSMEALAEATRQLADEGKLTPVVLERIARQIEALAAAGAPVPKILQFVADNYGSMAKSGAEAGNQTKALTERLAEAKAVLSSLTTKQIQNAEAGFKLGLSAEDVATQMKRLWPELKVTEQVMKLFEERMSAAASTAKTAAKDFAELTGATAIKDALDLTKQLGSGQLALAKMTEDAQRQVAAALFAGAEAWRAQGKAVPESVAKQIAAVASMRTIPDILKAHNAENRQALDGILKDAGTKVAAAADRMNDGMLKNLEIAVAAEAAALKIREDMEGDSLDLRLRRVRRDFEARRREIKAHNAFAADALLALAAEEAAVNAAIVRDWTYGSARLKTEVEDALTHAREQFEALRKAGTFAAEDVNAAWDRWYQEEEKRRHGTLIGWRNMWGQLADSFQQLAQIVGDGAFGEFLEWLGATVKGLEMAAQAGLDFEKGMAKIKDGNLAGGFADITSSVIAMTAAFMQATAQGGKLKSTLSGAAVGAQYGSAFGPAGAIVGAIVGGIAGFFRGKSRLAKEAHKIAEDFRKELGNGLWDAMRDAYGDEASAMAALSKLWAAEKKGPKEAQAAVDEINKTIKEHNRLVERAAEFQRTFGEVLNEVASGGRLVSRDLQRVIDKVKETGKASAELAAFLRGQLSRAASGLGAALEAGLADPMSGTAITTQATADAFAAAITGTFAAMLKNGMSVKDALAAIAPAMSALEKQMERAGLRGGAAFENLRRLIALSKDEIAGPALDAIASLNEALVGLHNAGLLDQQTFVGLANQITQTYQGLVKQGKGGLDALRLMQPSLQTLWELQQDFGYEVDKTTQAMLDQALAAGLIGDKHRDANEKIAKGLERLIELMEDFIRLMGGVPSSPTPPGAPGAPAPGTPTPGPTVPTPLPIPVPLPGGGWPEIPPGTFPGGGTPVPWPTTGTPWPELQTLGSDQTLDPNDKVAVIEGDKYELSFTIHAVDTLSVERMMRDKFIPAFEDSVRRNDLGIRTSLSTLLETP